MFPFEHHLLLLPDLAPLARLLKGLFFSFLSSPELFLFMNGSFSCPNANRLLVRTTMNVALLCSSAFKIHIATSMIIGIPIVHFLSSKYEFNFLKRRRIIKFYFSSIYTLQLSNLFCVLIYNCQSFIFFLCFLNQNHTNTMH